MRERSWARSRTGGRATRGPRAPTASISTSTTSSRKRCASRSRSRRLAEERAERGREARALPFLLVLEEDERVAPWRARERLRFRRELGLRVIGPAQAEIAPRRGRRERGLELVVLREAERRAARREGFVHVVGEPRRVAELERGAERGLAR